MKSSKKLLLRWTTWFFFFNTLLFWIIGLRYLEWIAPNAFDVINVFYKGVVWSYILITWLSHFALLAFILALVTMILIFIYPKRQCIFIFASVLAAAATALLILDSCVFIQFHYHLNGVLLQMARSEARDQLFAISTAELFFFGLLFIALAIIEYTVGLWIWKKVAAQPKTRYGFSLGVTLSTLLFFSYTMFLLSTTSPTEYAVITQQSQAFPLYNNFLAALLPLKNSVRIIETAGRSHFVQPAQPSHTLHYPLSPLQCAHPTPTQNIVFIVIDAWRADMLTAEVVPTISQFSKVASVYSNHFSGGNATGPGIFSLFYGLPHTYWSSMLKVEQGPVFLHALREAHYDMGIFSSAALIMPAFDHTVFSEVPELKLRTQGENPLERDKAITQEFKQFVAARKNSNRPFFSFLFYDSAHSYCDIPTLSTPFQPVISPCNRLMRNSATDPTPYFNRYKNALRFIDQQINEALHTLASHHLLENTVVVITSDHGQEFNDNQQGYWEHAGNFTAMQTKVPLIVYWPHQKTQRFSHQTNHFDIAPTLLTQILGCKNSPADYSLGKLLSSHKANHYLLIGSYIDYGIVESDRITTIYPTGNFTIEDLHAKLIPGAKLRVPVVSAVFSDMMRFYQSNHDQNDDPTGRTNFITVPPHR